MKIVVSVKNSRMESSKSHVAPNSSYIGAKIFNINLKGRSTKKWVL